MAMMLVGDDMADMPITRQLPSANDQKLIFVMYDSSMLPCPSTHAQAKKAVRNAPACPRYGDKRQGHFDAG